jgi:hypothetical protein
MALMGSYSPSISTSEKTHCYRMDKSSTIYSSSSSSSSSWESRPAEARGVTEPLGMHAWRSSTLLFAARFAERRRPTGVEATGLGLWRGEILDHSV